MAVVTGVAATRPDLPLPAPSEGGNPAGQEAHGFPGSVRLRVFQPTGRVYAEVLDPNTREVVKTIPPMELLKLTASVQNSVGLLLDREG